VNPSAKYKATIQLPAWRDPVVPSQIEERPAVRKVLHIGRHIIRTEWRARHLEITVAMLVVRAQIPSGPGPEHLIARIEVEIQANYMNETVIYHRIRAPCPAASEHAEHIALAA
jgi:hypothetical protein